MDTQTREIITSMTKSEFVEEFKSFDKGFIIKFGAEWCGPCKKIEGLVKQLMSQTPSSVKCAVIDIDENFELYAFFKSKRLINGVPALFGYKKGNINGIPDDVVVGANEEHITLLFQKYIRD